MKYVIGVDLGTSATKTILVDQNGKIVAEASVKYPMYQPENGWAEQDPSDWSEAAISTIKSVVEKGQVNGKDVRGIGISGQMHGLVMLNEFCLPQQVDKRPFCKVVLPILGRATLFVRSVTDVSCRQNAHMR